MELAHNLLNTGGSEALLTSGESEQWNGELLTGRGRSRDSSLDGAWEALLGLTVSGAPRDSLDERHAPQEAAGRRLNGGMMFPAEGDAFPDEPRLGALAIVRRSLDQGRPDTPTMTALLHSIFVDDGDDSASVAPSAVEDAEEDVALPEALAEEAELAAEAAEAALAAASDVLLRETSGLQGLHQKHTYLPRAISGTIAALC
eukprot:jgi/Astpho2/10004/fgenesh1_pg.00153_%23_21_t